MRTIFIIIIAAIVFTAFINSNKNPKTTITPSNKIFSISSEESETLAAKELAVTDIPMKEAFFGETHIHTAFSLDALIGGAKILPDDAYRWAKGETYEIGGEKHNIGRPLDFAAVTDHSEFLGECYSGTIPTAIGYDNLQLKELRKLNNKEEQRAWFMKYVITPSRNGTKGHPPFFAGPESVKSAWKVELEAVQKNYEPGKFTTIPGFEFTSTYKGGNMHRNVFFRDMTLPEVPLDVIDAPRVDQLWAWMVKQEINGSKVFAIPHNSNGSKGYMFGSFEEHGQPYDADYAQLRNKMEPLVEMMQAKGNSEVIKSFWPADEFSDFENATSIQNYSGRTFTKNDFVRWALIKGLDYKNTLGTNPFQLGFVGGTDNHNGTPGDVSESNFIGSHGAADKTVEDRRNGEVDGWIKGKDLSIGSLTGVWATKNTRGAIWDGMKNRETFATSGTRIKVRFFGGKNLITKPANINLLIKDGYANGVPMGGSLNPMTKAPTFNVYAQKDPEGANLDRIQIIKGWVDAKGEQQERIIEVVWSGNRKKDASGKIASVGNTVNLKTAKYTNSIGATTLMGSWTDDKFDPKTNALYYVRVLEIPTPRWSTYDAVRNNLPLLNDVQTTIQERAWASPIWYNAK